MAFAETLAHPRGQEAVLAQQDGELKFMEGVRKYMVAKVKADRDYAGALLSAVTTARKMDPLPVPTPLYQAWCAIITETEKISKLLKERSDHVQNQILDKLVEGVTERRSARKAFNEDKQRLEAEYNRHKDSVHKKKCEYIRCMGQVKMKKAKLEEVVSKGQTGAKLEDPKKKFTAATEKLHKSHNEYTLSVEEAKLYESSLHGQILPSTLATQQTVLQHQALQTKDLLSDFLHWTDLTSNEYRSAHESMMASVSAVVPEQEYTKLSEGHKSSPEPYEFKFEERTHEGYTGSLEPGVLAVDDLTLDSLKESKADFGHRRDASLAEKSVLAEKVKEAEQALESTLKSQVSPAELFRKTCEVRIYQQEQLELEEEGVRFNGLQSLIEQCLTPAVVNSPPVVSRNSVADINTAVPNGHNQKSSAQRHTQVFPPGFESQAPAAVAGIKDKVAQLGNFIKKRTTRPHSTATGWAEKGDGHGEPAAGESSAQRRSAPQAHSDLMVQSPSGQLYEMTRDPEQPLEEELWFHGILPREEVQRLLKEDGDYLVRESKKKGTGDTQYVLSVMWQGPKHFIIQVNDSGHWRLEGQSFASIQLLLINQHKLGTAVTNKSKAILYKPIMREEWQVRNDDVLLEERIGNGNFGEVFKGQYKGELVAIKTCKEELSDDQKKKFIQEGRILRQYDHPNIVKFVGIAAQKNPVMILMEFVSGGALLSWLRKRGNMEEKRVLVKVCQDAASGMEYLESKNVIHRDLAARNCLIASGSKVVKISDFGMSREEETYVVSGGLRQIPIKWTAPEALNYGTYTSLCDVWSYGILMWEIFSAGVTPYPGMKNQDARKAVDNGHRMDKPDNCPADVYQIMHDCWSIEPEMRPHFSTICARLRLAYSTHSNS